MSNYNAEEALVTIGNVRGGVPLFKDGRRMSRARGAGCESPMVNRIECLIHAAKDELQYYRSRARYQNRNQILNTRSRTSYVKVKR